MPPSTSSSAFIHANDIRLHYLEWSGGEPAVLCLPGITANAHAFTGLAEALSPRHRVIAMDLRGRGESDKPSNGYDVGTHVADAASLLEGLGIARAIVVGWSLGAKVGLALTAIHPRRVERLVLIDPPVETSPEAAAALRGFWARLDNTYDSVEAFLARMRLSPAFQHWTDDVERYLRADVEQTNGVVRHRIPRWVPERELEAEDRYPTRTFYARITCPTLLLRAPQPLAQEGDQVLSADHAREMAAALSNCRLVEVAGVNHFTILLGRPCRTLETIGHFLLQPSEAGPPG